jgi:DNA-binding response OmpR family regulator
MKTSKILVVDDDPAIRKFIRANLTARGYEVFLAFDGEEGLRVLETEMPDLILLDIMMPRIDGLEVCRRVREWSKIPIIMLSARAGEMDKVKCLDCGADDYLTKPFSLKELLSRIKAVLRRTGDLEDKMTVYRHQIGELVIDLNQNRVSLNKKDISLTATEFKIISYLAVNAGRMLTYDQILTKVWGEEYTGDNHLLQVSMARIRKKLNDDGKKSRYFENRIGIGYSILKNIAE